VRRRCSSAAEAGKRGGTREASATKEYLSAAEAGRISGWRGRERSEHEEEDAAAVMFFARMKKKVLALLL
jgi:hypothetical protein